MKTVVSITFILGLSMISCKKDYVCQCTTSSNAPNAQPNTEKFTHINVTKSQAQSSCITTKSDFISGGITYTQTRECKLQ